MSAIQTSGSPAGPQPEDAYFDVMAEQARTHWWYRARRALVGQILRATPGARDAGSTLLLDVGCGTGDNMGALAAAARCAVVGTDLSRYALAHCPPSAAGDAVVAMAFGEWLPLASDSADVITCMDVIEHCDDDVVVLEEFRRVLRPGGLLVVTTSSYSWMWSEHDVWAAHRRRYNARGLAAAARRAGFEVVRTSYYNSSLLLPAWLLRRTPLRRLVRTSNDEVGAASPLVDRVFSAWARVERWWIGRWRFPFGLSVLLVARRPRA